MTLGLTAASAAVIVSVADYSWVAAAITLGTACVALFMRVHPLWAFAAAALFGLAGLVRLAHARFCPHGGGAD